MIDLALFAALADPTRQRIVERLARGSCSVSELAAEMPVSRSAVSQHLKRLLDAGAVCEQRSGRFRHYRLDTCAAQLRSYAERLEPQASASMDAPPAAGDRIAAVARSLSRVYPDQSALSIEVLTRLILLGRTAQDLLASAAHDHGITVADTILLGTLRRLPPPHESTPTQLSRVALLSLPMMTRHLDFLHRLGLIERKAAPDDGRSTLIRLTAKGAMLIDGVVRQQFSQNLVAIKDLSATDLGQLAQMLRKLLAEFQSKLPTT